MTEAIAGAVHGMRLLTDGTWAVTLHFEPKDRAAVMAMMGEPGASIACVRLVNGHAAVPSAPAAKFADLGPICREAIGLGRNPLFHRWASFEAGLVIDTEARAREFILEACMVGTRKDLDIEPARGEFIRGVRKPFHAWLDRQPKAG